MIPSLEPTLEQLHAEITSLRITLAHREEVILHYNALFDFLTERALAGDRIQFARRIQNMEKVLCELACPASDFPHASFTNYSSTSQLALDSVRKLHLA